MKYLLQIISILLLGMSNLYGQSCEWVVGDWSPCEGPCGSEMQSRLVVCQCDGVTVSDANCNLETKPASTQTCGPEGPFSWEVGDWEGCSEDCGDGIETRLVQCVDLGNSVVDDCYCEESKPTDVQECNLGDCGLGIGVNDPTASLHVNGSFRFQNGNEDQDKILVSDELGNASWQDLSSINGPENKIIVTTFQNGYTQYEAGFENLSYYKHDDRVYIQGLVNRSVGVFGGHVIFTLPEGYRPAAAHIFEGRQNTSGCRIDIRNNGEVFVASCEIEGGFSYLSLSGISFRL